MAATLDDAWARVEWAYSLLVQLEELLDPFEESQPYEIREEIRPDGTQRTLIADNPRPVPPAVPFLFGDLVHALHAALDYVVCSAVELAGQTPSTKTAFPIFDTEPAYLRAAPTMLKHVAVELALAIERLQPYHDRPHFEEPGRTAAEVDVMVRRMPRMRLYHLSITEKHRALLLASPIFNLRMYVGHNRTADDRAEIGFKMSAARDKAYIVLPRDPANPVEHFDPHFSAHVTLERDGPNAMSVTNLARMLYNDVAHHVMADIAQTGVLPLTRPRMLPFYTR